MVLLGVGNTPSRSAGKWGYGVGGRSSVDRADYRGLEQIRPRGVTGVAAHRSGETDNDMDGPPVPRSYDLA